MRLICVGTKMPAWVITGFDDYAKRMRHINDFELKEIPLHKRTKHNLTQVLNKESQSIMQTIQQQDYVVALDVLGKHYDTPQLAQRLDHWQSLARPISFIIGGPEGIHDDVKGRADESWSLSQLTLPHPLVRIVFIEQIYRAWSILTNHPYHRN